MHRPEWYEFLKTRMNKIAWSMEPDWKTPWLEGVFVSFWLVPAGATESFSVDLVEVILAESKCTDWGPGSGGQRVRARKRSFICVFTMLSAFRQAHPLLLGLSRSRPLSTGGAGVAAGADEEVRFLPEVRQVVGVVFQGRFLP